MLFLDRIRKTFFLLLCLVPVAALGQPYAVSARLDTLRLRIGEQTQLHFEWTAGVGRMYFPQFSDTLSAGVEIVGNPVFDSVRLDDGTVKIRASLTVTAFDSALYRIPSQHFVSGADTLLSNPLVFRVETVPVDTLLQQVTDIKTVYEPARNLWRIILYVAVALLLVPVTVFLVKYFNKKKREKEQKRQEIPVLTPEEIKEAALRELERIRADKLWERGLPKEFYTDLTAVLRQYIAGFYKIDAPEMTSGEILESLSGQQVEPYLNEKLRYLLTLADLVKFAKWKPQHEDFERSMEAAFDFVR